MPNPIFYPLILVGALLICRGIDAFITDLRTGILTKLGFYQSCEDCAGYGYLRTGKRLFKRRVTIERRSTRSKARHL